MTSEQEEQIIDLRRKHFFLRQIVKITGVSQGIVQRFCDYNLSRIIGGKRLEVKPCKYNFIAWDNCPECNRLFPVENMRCTCGWAFGYKRLTKLAR